MQDLAYVVATVAFFALMIAFARGLDAMLGADDDSVVPGGILDAVASSEPEVPAR